jgi:hypothetical protein
MGDCIFCGKSAGLFHHEHHDCRDRHENGKRKIGAIILAAITSELSPVDEAVQRIGDAAEQSFISETERESLSIAAWSQAVDHVLDRGIPTEEIQTRFIALQQGLHLSVLQTAAWDRLTKSVVLREIMNGIIPKRVNLEANISLNLQKNEQMVWAFGNSDYLEQRTHREYIGGSRGVSIRLAKGVYYHAASFKGRTIDRTELVHLDNGVAAATTKHIYFAGSNRAFRIPYTKVVAFEPFSDGLGIVRDTASARPQFFITHDGWFTYNLVTNLAKSV